ncbi:MAG: PilN domain-containing protein, partial [Chloroflexota bacterium]
YRPKPVLLTNVFALPSAAVAAIVLVLLLVLMQIASADIASMGDQLKTAELQLQQKMLQRSVLTNNIINLQKKIAETGASQNNLTAELGVLEGQTIGITRALEVATVSLSSNTSASVSYTNNIVTTSGRAPAGRVVISYFVKLDNSGRLGELTFQNMNIAAGGGSDFTIIGNLGKQVSGTSSTRVAIDNLPGDIIVNGVKFDKGTLTISGWSPDEDVVFSYARRLEATNRFHEVIIASIAQNEEEGMDFSIVINTGE